MWLLQQQLNEGVNSSNALVWAMATTWLCEVVVMEQKIHINLNFLHLNPNCQDFCSFPQTSCNNELGVNINRNTKFWICNPTFKPNLSFTNMVNI
jgi:hypothetical protein